MKHWVFFLFLMLVMPVTGQFVQQARPKVGLVLSGGGAKGLAHIGVLKVLEKAGIHIDYIGGTSMGSIIGGLYSIGYTPEELENMVVKMNWDSLLTDQISRQNLPFEEKDENARYFVSFPIREKKIGLPSGAISGQNIYELFNRMASPAYRESDFSKFPIPFLCVATNIEKGEPRIFREGYLPQAMRASMAIPSFFTPENIDGNIYVDGGVLNNLPVLEVKKMGADIIIGVDVGFRPMSTKALNSITGILTQSMYIFTKKDLDQNRNACNILIEPNLEKFNLMSFNEADSIIQRGEQSATEMLPRLKALADSLNQLGPAPERKKPMERFSSLIINEIEITGLKLISQEFILRKLDLNIPAEITQTELENKISLIYGTQFFDKISYKLLPSGDGTKIRIEVSERTANHFKVGIHYDSDFKTALLLNTTLRNIPIPGAKVSLDLALGENIAFNGLLYYNSGVNSDPIHNRSRSHFPDFGIRTSFHKMETFEYAGETRTASYNFLNGNLDIFWQKNLTNNSVAGGGILGDFVYINNQIGNTTFPETNYFHLNLHAYYKIDSYNQDFYPNRGIQLITTFRYIKGLTESTQDKNGFLQSSLRYSGAIPITRRFTLTHSVFLGLSNINTLPLHYRYYLGGQAGTYYMGLVPMVGLKYMQLQGADAWVAGMDFRYEVWDNNFVTIKTNICQTAENPGDLLKFKDLGLGGGISYGYRSVIGPMEISVMASNKVEGVTGFINIGYWF